MVRSSTGIASNIYETNDETWLWKDDTIDVDVNTDEVIMDTSSNAAYDKVISTCWSDKCLV